jgi:hypothetical protein
MMLAMRQACERIERLEQALRAAVPGWSLSEVVTALMAMRGMDLISATTFPAAEVRQRAARDKRERSSCETIGIFAVAVTWPMLPSGWQQSPLPAS